MKRVILESPYAGDIHENVKYAQRCMKHCLTHNEAPFPSHLLYPHVLNDNDPVERSQGLNAGFSWIPVADQSVIYVDRGISGGMKLGILEAQKNNILVLYRRIDPLPEPFYILISGKRCSGKDTFADVLKKHSKFGDLMEIRGFAKSLKHDYAKILTETLGQPVDEIYDKLLNDYAFKQQHRKGLIDHGISEKEKYCEDIWVQRLINLGKNAKITIIPDVRYKYELFHKNFTRQNSIKVLISCTNENRGKRGWKYTSGVDDNHSECDLDNVDSKTYDFIIDNNGDLLNVENQVKVLLAQYCL